ncbi:MAG: VWA domain-containing protein [Acidobacteria bacterium]|nr:VWA domain-containing protein [Acidobacteriota bacterium]
MFSPTHSQSGRNKSEKEPDNKRPAKPLPPAPLPKVVNETRGKSGNEDSIRINSDLVTVTVTTLKNSTEKAALAKEDFTILEDGVAQEVTNFARESETPLRMVVLFDASMSVAQRLNFEKKAAAKFFDKMMRPQDQAAVFAVATETDVMQEFTNKPQLLSNATRQLKAGGATALYDGIYLAAEYLRATSGRRVIVLVTDGGDTVSHKTLKEALQITQEVDAVIYSVYTGKLWGSQNLRDIGAERALSTLTKETGGEVFAPTLPTLDQKQDDDTGLKQLDEAFSQLADQLRTQYVLGYYSANEARDGAYRKIEVKVNKPGYALRHRAGYYVPKS